MKEFIKELRAKNALVLDTETTGLDNRAEILQIGIVSMDGEELFSSLVKPVRAKSWPEAMRVHKIAPAYVQNAPTIGELTGELERVMHGRSTAIYNADFDSRMLWQSVRANGADRSFRWMGDQKWECVMKAYAAYWGQRGRYGYKWQSLSNACRQQGVKVANAHDALGDAKLTAALIRVIEKKLR